MSRWESIVTTAREIDQAFANGSSPELTTVMRLARSVMDFQQQLTGTRSVIQARIATPRTRTADAAAE